MNLYYVADSDGGGTRYIIAKSITVALGLFIVENKYNPEGIKLIDRDILIQEEK